MTEKEAHLDFLAYLKQCTDNQVLGVLDKERKAERWSYAALAVAEAEKRGLDYDRF